MFKNSDEHPFFPHELGANVDKVNFIIKLFRVFNSRSPLRHKPIPDSISFDYYIQSGLYFYRAGNLIKNEMVRINTETADEQRTFQIVAK